jgi:outer membrane receptor protein involved in Fe transport
VDEADPLVIIDGKVVGQGKEALSKLSPNDIQSVTVLKGENALNSIYGSAVKEAKKQNGLTPAGVIIITTKEAAQLEEKKNK